MGRKSKNKKKLTIPIPDLPPPVLTREVSLTPERDRSPSPSPSPTGSICSNTSSLLSIGPPPYVTTPKPPKKKGASKSAVASYVASTQAAMAEAKVSTSKKNEAFPIAGSSKCRDYIAPSYSMGSSMFDRAADPPKPKLMSFAKSAATQPKGGHVSKPAKPKITNKASTTNTSKQGKAKPPKASPKGEDLYGMPNLKSATASSSVGTKKYESKSGSKNKNAKKIEAPAISPMDTCPSYAQTTSRHFSPPPAIPSTSKGITYSGLSMGSSVPGTSKEALQDNLLLTMDGCMAMGSSFTDFGREELAPPPNPLLGRKERTSFVDNDDNDDSSFESLETSQFANMTDEILDTIEDRELAFEELAQYDLADFPNIYCCILEEQKSVDNIAIEKEVEIEKAPVDDVQNPQNVAIIPIGIANLDGLQIELETLCSSVIRRAIHLTGEHRLLQSVAASTRRIVKEVFKDIDTPAGKQSQASTKKIAKEVVTEVETPPPAKQSQASTKKITKEVSKEIEEPLAKQSPTRSRKAKQESKRSQQVATEEEEEDAGPSTPPTRASTRQATAAAKGRWKPPAKTRRTKKEKKNSVPAEWSYYYEDVPTSFWEFAEQYVRPVIQEDVDNLKRLIAEHAKQIPPELFEIPPLGKHYKEQEKEEKAKKANGNGEDEGKKKKEEEQPGTSDPDKIGRLTNKLVDSLVRDSVAMHFGRKAREEAAAAAGVPLDDDVPEPSILDRPGLAKLLGLDLEPGEPRTDQRPLEERIRESLVNNDLEISDLEDEDMECISDDEILAEIVRTQDALKKVHVQNSAVLQSLMIKASKSVEIFQLEGELNIIDLQVQETFQNLKGIKDKNSVNYRTQVAIGRQILTDRTNVIAKLRKLEAERDRPLLSENEMDRPATPPPSAPSTSSTSTSNGDSKESPDPKGPTEPLEITV